jgi:uncharacterized protein (TIGR02145 family)
MKNKINIITFKNISYLTLILLALSSCNDKNKKINESKNIIIDKPDTIPTVIIGNSTWMKNCLSVDTFSNGDTISYCQDEKSWYNACENGIPAFCISLNNKAIKYYNYHCITDERGIAPKGFKIPSKSELEKKLIIPLNYKPLNPIISSASDEIWSSLTELRTKSDIILPPNGARLSESYFDKDNNTSYLWTSTSLILNGEKGSVYYFRLDYKDIYEGWSSSNAWNMHKEGFSILCIKGDSHDSKGNLILDEIKESNSVSSYTE